MAEIDALFRLVKKEGCSDLHLASGNRPLVRLHGELRPLQVPPLTQRSLSRLLKEICSAEQWACFLEAMDLDFAYALGGVGRFRANYFRQKKGVGAVFRQIPEKILSIEELRLPPILSRLADLRKGLVLVTGPTGSGKSTTLAAIIDHANRHRRDHIITIEDPIEFEHDNKSCVVSHREVATHTRSFAAALRAALREDPDIILVGEMRDLETIALAIEAANTGHLVLGTLHTQNATRTVDRIVEVFPPTQQNQIRSTLSESIRGVVAQTLFKRVDKPGRVAALEILIATPAVRNLIREGKTSQLASILQMGKSVGMQTLDDSIMEHVSAGRISEQDAYAACLDKERFKAVLREPLDDPFEA